MCVDHHHNTATTTTMNILEAHITQSHNPDVIVLSHSIIFMPGEFSLHLPFFNTFYRYFFKRMIPKKCNTRMEYDEENVAVLTRCQE